MAALVCFTSANLTDRTNVFGVYPRSTPRVNPQLEVDFALPWVYGSDLRIGTVLRAATPAWVLFCRCTHHPEERQYPLLEIALFDAYDSISVLLTAGKREIFNVNPFPESIIAGGLLVDQRVHPVGCLRGASIPVDG